VFPHLLSYGNQALATELLSSVVFSERFTSTVLSEQLPLHGKAPAPAAATKAAEQKLAESKSKSAESEAEPESALSARRRVLRTMFNSGFCASLPALFVPFIADAAGQCPLFFCSISFSGSFTHSRPL
jgi:hypothetical protein